MSLIKIIEKRLNKEVTYTNNKLCHSDIYLGKEFSNGLYHYKYLKKVRSASGKWRYIYDESELKKAEKEIQDLKTARKNMPDKDGYISYINKDGDYVSKNPKTGSSIKVYDNRKQTKEDKFKENIDSNIKKKERAHAKQKLKDIPKRTIARGIGLVNSVIMKLEKKRRK